ncbi:MAG: sulfite exporter TauE/SafE family protein [Candidatus Omnitrophica bacterium]|nr:sulfite exporter TauE/SafE family protein [Candidatus Omnitrophota bacterium]
MPYVVVCVSALLTSCLTLFSGFGLGTLLMPVFALFFPITVAIALTAVVHFLNNLFKLALTGRWADWSLVWRFGLPGLGGAVGGAWLLVHLSELPPVAGYWLFGRHYVILPVKSVIVVVMAVFALLELLPCFQRLSLPPHMIPWMGFVSGVFGGLSGHQGALRSAVLMQCGLSKEQFIGTGVMIACLVDVTRLAIYLKHLTLLKAGASMVLLGAATVSAFLGAWLGARLLPKVTLQGVRLAVAALLLAIAGGLGSGLL